MTIPKRIEEVIEEHSNKVIIVANTGQMKYKTGGTFQGLLVEAKIGEERIGYLTAEKRKDGNYVIDGVFVEENYRNNGIATDMLRKAQRTVQMAPYITTENQVYQSEAGKKLAEKEYRMMTASTVVTAGPLLAVPELLGAGEAAAGAGEAAAGAGEAASGAEETEGSNTKLPSQNNNQQQGNQQQSGQQQGGLVINEPVIEGASPLHPNFTSSKLSTTVAWPDAMHAPRHPGLQLTKEFLKNLGENEAMTAPADAFPGTDAADVLAAGIKTIRQNPSATSDLIKNVHQKIKEMPTKKQNPLVMPAPNTGTDTDGQNVQVDTTKMQPSTESATSNAEHNEVTTPAKSEEKAKDKTKGRSLPSWGGMLKIEVPHTVVQTNSPMHPMFSSRNDKSRLLNLIGELYYAKKENWYEPEDESTEQKVEDHDRWAETTNHGEYEMPGEKKPLPPTSWE